MTLRGRALVLPLTSALLAAALPVPGAADATRSSPGCGTPAPKTPPAAAKVDGEERSLIPVIPKGYDPAIPHDLIVAFHGRTNPPERVRGYYDLEDHVRRPTLFVYPRGLPAEPGTRGWWDPGDPASDLRDYALLEAVVSRFSELDCVDRDRVFAVGHSLGASFVNSLGCARGGILRGIATVAGGIEGSRCRGEAAALLVHHPDDRLVPFALGEAARDRLIAANGLDWDLPTPLRTIAPPPGFCCERRGDWTGNPVVWCRHTLDQTRSGRVYPHQWPQGTGALIMAFFAALR